MSLDFAIVPFDSTFEESALSIKSNITDEISSINIEVDTDYSKSYNTRIKKWKQQDYNIIGVNQEYTETNHIIVIFSEHGSKQERMSVDEFIELVNNFDHRSDSDNDEEGGCILS